ncbi:carbohydrate kinase family protein [Frigidibacter sp.]|uniref:carbohydrate kinase family protein n=1 Tax=Frigidibacter sp. TaxID=2586418 RepID=UPI002732EDB7|nr:carbohydrate kinase family protein [Frigidibacter sp.]MDP3340781.1 carbohydrate kinase family protein [Frigidibacter sp.]
MHVAGGIYLETCETPSWSGLWGSGLRAAIAISEMSEKVTLHGYLKNNGENLTSRLASYRVSTEILPRHHDVVFSYFHPLSDPLVEPAHQRIRKQRALLLSADNILRFSYLEGSACVHGSHVVYDPQSPRGPEKFHENGSTAENLALVMNENEFKAYSASDDLDEGASRLLKANEAQVIVVKRGIFGANVYQTSETPFYVPAYQSERIFKIGTGDVFSAAFSYFWAEKRQDANQAADLASRAVASYCENPTVPINSMGLRDRKPIQECRASLIEVYGSADTLGRLYTRQEALYCIRSLGLEASIGSGTLAAAGKRVGTVSLVIVDGFPDQCLTVLDTTLPGIIFLDEEHRLKPAFTHHEQITDDFTSSIYKACMQSPVL